MRIELEPLTLSCQPTFLTKNWQALRKRHQTMSSYFCMFVLSGGKNHTCDAGGVNRIHVNAEGTRGSC